MTVKGSQILEDFRQLTAVEKCELIATLVQEVARETSRLALPERSIPDRIRLDPGLANEIALSDAFNPEEA